MKMILLPLWFGISLVIGHPLAQADQSLSDDLVNNLYSMRGVYRAEYAPAGWKKKFAAYDLDTQFNQAIAAAQANPGLTVSDARAILIGFIYAMKDYHTSISFVSTEQATLPFTLQTAANRYFLAFIDRSKLTEAAFPFHVGDELVTVDGKPAADAIAAIQATFPENIAATDQALATLRFTHRLAARGLTVPKGPVTLGFRASGTNSPTEIQLIWEYTPEGIAPRSFLTADVTSRARSPIFHPMMNVEIADPSAPPAPSPAPAPVDPFQLGKRNSFTPPLGTKIWESADSDFFHAYLYKDAASGKLIGYVRIASYEAPDYPAAVASFAKVVALFESTTDAMIVDQVNNPGGSVFYLYALASMLTDHPLATPRHRMSITQSDVSDAVTAIAQMQAVKNDDDAKKALKPDDLSGYPASYEFAQFTLNYAQFIVTEWKAGRKLTAPFWIGGVDHINPAPTHYSKPILLITNHTDFSGGDFFPAILQDNKRVTVFGSRTAGAGGYVNDVKVPNNIGVDAFRVTESIAERLDGNPIENLGITPDIAYEITPADLTQGYADYTKAIRATVNSLK